MIKFKDSNPRTGDFAKTESNDCTVRAAAVALDMPYYKVHEAFSKAGRKPGRGVCLDVVDSVLKALKGDKIRTTGFEWFREHRMTLSALIRKHPKGRFVVVKRGHAFALIDGVAHDMGPVGGRTKVWQYWEVLS
jgi:hypothetical protein